MRALLLTGGIYHDFDSMAAASSALLAAAGFEVESFDHPAGLAAGLAVPADLVVVQALRWRMLGHPKYAPFRAEWAYETTPELIAALGGHHGAGGGILALHTGCICFDDWPGWQEMLGGGWRWGTSFHAPEPEPLTISPVAGHPVTAGIAPHRVTDELYRDLALQEGVQILAEGETGAGVRFAVAWAREGAGRAVTLTTGHDLAALTEPGQAGLIRQAALWAARSNERIGA